MTLRGKQAIAFTPKGMRKVRTPQNNALCNAKAVSIKRYELTESATENRQPIRSLTRSGRWWWNGSVRDYQRRRRLQRLGKPRMEQGKIRKRYLSLGRLKDCSSNFLRNRFRVCRKSAMATLFPDKWLPPLSGEDKIRLIVFSVKNFFLFLYRLLILTGKTSVCCFNN